METDLQSINPAPGSAFPLGRANIFPLSEGLPNVPGFQAILSLYKAKRGTAIMPKRSSIGFADLRGWHSKVGIIEFNDQLSDGTTKILGESYRACFGGILAPGMKVSETLHPKVAGLIGYFTSLLTTPAVGYFTGHLPNEGRRHVKVEVLDLPAFNDQGEPRFILSFIRSAET